MIKSASYCTPVHTPMLFIRHAHNCLFRYSHGLDVDLWIVVPLVGVIECTPDSTAKCCAGGVQSDSHAMNCDMTKFTYDADKFCTKSYCDQDGIMASLVCNAVHRLMQQHAIQHTFKWRRRARLIIRDSRRMIASVMARSMHTNTVDEQTHENIERLRSMLMPLEQVCRSNSGCIEAFLWH